MKKLYCARGDMENRIKEQQLMLFADRTSTNKMHSNQVTALFLFYWRMSWSRHFAALVLPVQKWQRPNAIQSSETIQDWSKSPNNCEKGMDIFCRRLSL